MRKIWSLYLGLLFRLPQFVRVAVDLHGAFVYEGAVFGHSTRVMKRFRACFDGAMDGRVGFLAVDA